MSRKSVLSLFILLIFILNIFSFPSIKADMPYETVTTTVSYTISASTDDAYCLITSSFDNSATIGYLKDSTYDVYTGFRFDNVLIPVGATITNAYISLYSSDAVDSNSYLTSIYGIDADDYGTFAIEADLTGATVTSAFANWDMKDLEGGAWSSTTNLKGLVQEIINRVGWASGNALAFRLSSAISAYGFRSFRTYDYTGTTYDPKIYITYTVSTIISQANPWDYISDFNTNWTLLNETNGYTWWEVWNITGVKSSYGLVSAVNANQGRIYRLNFTDYADLQSGITLWSPAVTMQSGGDRLFVSAGSTLYCLGYKVSTGNIYLMNSTNSGDSWNLGIVVGNGNQFGMAYDGDNKIFINYRTGVDVYTYWVIYTISTKTVSSVYTANPNLTSVSRLSNPVYVPLGNKFMFTINGYTNVYIYSFDMDTLLQDAVVGIAIGVAGYNPIIHPNSDSTEFYNLWWVSDALYGFTIDDDCVTYGATQTNIATGILNYGNVWYDLDHDGIKWTCTYLSSANKYLYMVERPLGIWGVAVLKSSLYTMTGFGYDYGSNILASNGYATFIQSFVTPTTKDVLSSAKSWGSVKQLTSIGSTIQGLDIVTVGSDVESTHQFILLDPEGNPVDEIPDYIIYQPDYLNSTYDKWLFEGEVYKMEISVNNTDITYLTLNDTVHTLTFSYNNNTDVYKLEVANADGTLVNQLVAGLISSGKNDYSGNITSIWWKFILNTNIVDCIDRDFSYILQYTNSSSPYNILLTETGLIDANITIYNLGGVIEYTFTGDGGHTIGGHSFQIYATNSTLNSTARADIIYRRLQGVHLLAELNTDNQVDGVSGKFEKLSNVGYVQFGIDYKLEGNESSPWIEGWMVRIYVDDIHVGDNGILNDEAFVNIRVYWFNRGSLIRGDENVYSYHFGYDKDDFPSPRRSFTFWCDLWFDKSNSSTVFGGRVNPQYYGYYEAGSAWWFNSAFRPMTNNVTSSMLFDDIRDADGNIVSSKEISIVRVYAKVAKTASGGDADTYKLEPFQIMKMQLAKERMEGIDTPDFIETQQLSIAGYGMYNILGGVGAIISGALLGVVRLMMSSMDTFLSFFGLPYGTFSTLMNYISTSFSSLMGWLASATAVFGNMLSIFTLLVTSISSFITYTIATILFFLSDVFTIPLQLVQFIIAVLNGTTITFYGIPFDFTPYKDMMDGLKQLLPILGSMMYATWLLFGNITFEGEPDLIGLISRIRQSFDWIRETYNSVFWIFNAIYSEILFIYAWVKSHIPTMGGTPSSAPDTS